MGKLGGRSGLLARAVTACGAALLCAALFGGSAWADPAAPPVPPPATSAGAITSVQDLLAAQARIQELYRQAEQATERYNATNEQLGRTQTKVNDVNAGIVWARQNVEKARDDLGRLARLQYTSRGMDPLVTLMLSSQPEQFLRDAPTYEHITQTQLDTIARAKQAEQQLAAMQKSADSQLAESRRLEQEAVKAKADIEAGIAGAEKLVAGFTPEQVAELEAMEARAAEAGQAQLTTLIGKPDQQTTPKAALAIAWAIDKIGLPYIWGGVGPVGYDCSGLTSKAWAFAGVPIRRTSQEQWASLPRVPVAQMRPGDLIVYYSDASHIGMYLGNGKIVHAPRPGRTITIANAGSMPILGVVRPDAGAGTVNAPAIPNTPTPPPTTPVTPPPTTPPPTTPPPITVPPTTPPPTTPPVTTPPVTTPPVTTAPPTTEPPVTTTPPPTTPATTPETTPSTPATESGHPTSGAPSKSTSATPSGG
ncbi:NlpC/P60 family protein [Streptomyces sp. SID3343]|uniref:C40 family peptidase n=1 Tax=Streptomyces sp. SID3343 TaxID=2690260 RepID=UPI001369342C|nr:NlpC/P60 family protein [Streptomyces sp. SID3343]MYV97944.1 glycoside hydrolase [Streptomyces sp. SID3343]